MEDEKESIGSSYRQKSKKMKLKSEEDETTLQSEEETTLQSEEKKKLKEEMMAISLDLPNYKIMRLIAEGTFRKVYQAEHNIKKDIVAVKTFKKKKYVSFNIKREIKLLQKLQHPNIIRLIKPGKLSCNKENEPVYLVVEFMDDDLGSLAKGKPIPTPMIKDSQDYMQQLLRGLAHCHARNVLHRDIKCDNILLSKDGVLKIADFGLSRFVEVMILRMVILWVRNTT